MACPSIHESPPQGPAVVVDPHRPGAPRRKRSQTAFRTYWTTVNSFYFKVLQAECGQHDAPRLSSWLCPGLTHDTFSKKYLFHARATLWSWQFWSLVNFRKYVSECCNDLGFCCHMGWMTFCGRSQVEHLQENRCQSYELVPDRIKTVGIWD